MKTNPFLCLLAGLAFTAAGCAQLEQPLPQDEASRVINPVLGPNVGPMAPDRAPVPPQVGHQIAYYPFNRTTHSSVGSIQPSATIDIAYGPDHKGLANGAAYFNGLTSIVEITNGTPLFQPSMTWACWMKLDTTNGHGHFMMGMDFFRGGMMEFFEKGDQFKQVNAFAMSGSTSPDSLTFIDIYSGEQVGDRQGATVLGGVYPNFKRLLGGKWAHVAYTFNAASRIRTVFVNGQPVIRQNFNVASGTIGRITNCSYTPVAQDAELSNGFAFGFGKTRAASMWSSEPWGNYFNTGANHFKGALDEVRFYDVALTDAEVTALYNRER